MEFKYEVFNYNNGNRAPNSWNMRYSKAKDSFLSSARDALSRTMNPETMYRALDFILIFEGKQNNENVRTWEQRVAHARQQGFDFLNYLHSSSRIDFSTESCIGKSFVDLMNLAKEMREKERKQTNRGRLEKYAEDIEKNHELPAEFREKLEGLTELLKGNARDREGKIIWKWDDRILAVRRTYQELKDFSRIAYSTGKIDKESANNIQTLFNLAIDSGIRENKYLNKKNKMKIILEEFYSPVGDIGNPWVVEAQQPMKKISLSGQKSRNYLGIIKNAAKRMNEEVNAIAEAAYSFLTRPAFSFKNIAANLRALL